MKSICAKIDAGRCYCCHYYQMTLQIYQLVQLAMVSSQQTLDLNLDSRLSPISHALTLPLSLGEVRLSTIVTYLKDTLGTFEIFYQPSLKNQHQTCIIYVCHAYHNIEISSP